MVLWGMVGDAGHWVLRVSWLVLALALARPRVSIWWAWSLLESSCSVYSMSCRIPSAPSKCVIEDAALVSDTAYS